MTLRKILISLNLLIVSIVCYAQSPPALVVINPIDIIKSMNLEYKKPPGFDEVLMNECFNSYPKLERIITCAYGQLRSTDQQFFVFTGLYRTLSVDDSVFISKISAKGMGIKSLDWMYEANIKAGIEESLGKDAAQYWRKFVNYYSADKAREIYNADSVITYSIKLDSANYYQRKYNHLDILCIAKKRRGAVYFFCFYTDEGKKLLPDYQKAIEGMFRFKD